jgi:hypothetical protein
MKSFWKSKKFWSAIVAAIVGFTGEYGLNLPPEVIWAVLGPIIAYIIGQGVADSGIYRAQAERNWGVPITSTFSTAPEMKPTREPKDEEVPPISDATRLFEQEWRKSYILTNPADPAQVEADYLGHYEAVLELAKKMFEEQKGYYPENDIEDPCRTGDYSYPSKWLYHSQRELQIRRDMVEAVKKNPLLKYQIGGLGYLLWGTPWNEMPQWVRLSLMRHVEKE